jgi:hypothetical protein
VERSPNFDTPGRKFCTTRRFRFPHPSLHLLLLPACEPFLPAAFSRCNTAALVPTQSVPVAIAHPHPWDLVLRPSSVRPTEQACCAPRIWSSFW